jgi:hypothetical protein
MQFQPKPHPAFADPNSDVPPPPDPNPLEPDTATFAPSEAETEEALTPELMGQPAKSPKDLDTTLQNELLALAKKVVDSYSVPRMALVKTVQEGRNFLKGLQNLKWNPAAQRFDPATTPIGNTGSQSTQEEIEPTTLNIFQAKALSLISALSATAPACIYMPDDPENPDDLATAKVGAKLSTRFERINHIEEVMAQELQYAFTDGYIGLFIRYQVNGDRWGYRTTQQQAAQPITMPGMEGDTTSAIPRNVGTIRVPNGEEVVDALGALELSIPAYGRSQYDYPAIEWQTETPVALLRAIYTDRLDEINEGGDAGTGTADATERNARLLLANAPPGYDGRFGNASSPDLVTYKRTWIRKWAFYGVESKDTREKLLALFPDGAYVAHANELLLDARNECMDDHWVIYKPLPGDGSYGEPVGGSSIPVQRAINNLVDRQLQNDAFGVPPIFYDSKLLDGDAYADTIVKPAKAFPVNLAQGKKLSDVMYSPPPTALSPASTEIRNFLIQITAELTGVQPALFGGQESGAGGETAEGYRMAMNQAMGRLGLVYRAMKTAHARMSECLLRIMAKERKENIVIPMLGDDDSYKSDVIQVSDMQGRVKVSAEMEEDLPTTWSQHKDLLAQMQQSQNPAIQAIACAPQNLSLFKRTVGWDELYIPGEDAQSEQDMETTKLIQDGQPITQTDPMTGAPAVDPTTGQPIPPQPSVPIDPMDNHQIHYARGQAWKESSEGRKLRLQNPPAYQNAHLHFMAHFAAMAPPPPAPPPAPSAMVVPNTSHLVAPTGETLWSAPGQAPGAAGPQGAMNQPSAVPAPLPPVTHGGIGNV